MPPRVRLLLALALDAALVLVFVALGREEHDDTSATRDVLTIALPFWFGLLAGWVAAKVWRQPWALRTGLMIWPAVVIVGMLTRRWVFGDGTAPAFVIVATLFLGAGLVGWRALAHLSAARRAEP
jgi:cytochrome bd-type quinol oxidase subunit 1